LVAVVLKRALTEVTSFLDPSGN